MARRRFERTTVSLTTVFLRSVCRRFSRRCPASHLGVSDDTFGQNGGRLANLPRLAPPNVAPVSLAQPPAYGTSTFTVVDPNLEIATTHMWSFGIQHEILPRTVLSVDYMGRRAYNLYGAYNANQPEIFRNGFLDAFKTAQTGRRERAARPVDPARFARTATESGAAFLRRQFPTEMSLNSVGAVAQSLGQRIQKDASGNDANLRRSPDSGRPSSSPSRSSGSLRVIDSNDFSTYHGLEVQILKRMSNGVEAQFSWTWSKSLDTRSYDPSLTLYGTGDATIGHVAALRYCESQAELCAVGLRPAPRVEFLLDLGASHSVRNATWIQLLGGWQVGRIPPVSDRASVHDLLRREHTVERFPEHGAMQRMLA